MNLIITIFILGIIIFIHELGHFLTAKYFKMPVAEFAIGMGPKIYSHETLETTYSIRAIPIGGFVNIEGMEVESKVKDGFNSKPPLARFIVLFAGVFMNFILALVIIYGMVVASGKVIQNEEAVVGNVMEQSKAYNVLQKGDEILEINNRSIDKWDEILGVVREEIRKEGDTLKMVVLRDGKDVSLEIEPYYDEERKQPIIGILPDYSVEKYGLAEGLKVTGTTFVDIFAQTLNGLKMLVTGKVKADEVTGPVGMIKVVEQASKGGALLLVWLTAVLSVNIGIFNLLPFPALDGGRIVFVVLELMGVNVNKKLEERLHMAGMIILLGLILLITMNDVSNMFIRK